MAKDFYIFRHGETELNRRRRWQGSGTDYDLTEDGVSQAEELSAKLAGKGIEVIYSSPVLRARHTAEIAARMLKVPVKTEADLRECFYGEAEGRPIAELQKEMPEIVNNWSRPGGDLRFPGGESRQEALERVLAVLRRLEGESFRTAGVAVHGGTMAAMLNHFGYKFDKIPNCAVFRLHFENGEGTVEGNLF